MMNRRLLLVAAVAATALITGCASGPKYAEIAKSIPALKPGEGRIYVFRSDSMLGAAIQPEVRLNNEVVGKSVPGGFFYVDRPAGKYTAATTTETEKRLSFSLDAGETKYLRTSISMGAFAGHVAVEVEDPQKAKTEIETLSYVGTPAK